ncbi:sensor histidine kinase [Mesonia maritima]|uniref:LytS/YehU family sensor histidine kinase n=1 Tax=Mesonia maritima TaxID=1793873 RepID=A0ABU1K8G8_9FLAO|nr:histidine kinase [Mesonia maritima]MDR6301910.1 LytS/YehU family sensor histidine kinase [Mesonia maritima]
MAYEKKHQELEKNVLKIEIEHLRTQLSPHFTFNILNNLQFLIRKDKDEALELLSRYSKILKYYIYESQNRFIQLEDEITFLKYYFQIEKDKSNEELGIHFSLNDIPKNQLLIIPFLLSTFIENAFKHVAPNTNGNFIHLKIFVKNDSVLNLDIENTFAEFSSEEKRPGVGLEQAKKRLELSYPDNYELHQETENGIYKVELKINLSKNNEMYRS